MNLYLRLRLLMIHYFKFFAPKVSVQTPVHEPWSSFIWRWDASNLQYPVQQPTSVGVLTLGVLKLLTDFAEGEDFAELDKVLLTQKEPRGRSKNLFLT